MHALDALYTRFLNVRKNEIDVFWEQNFMYAQCKFSVIFFFQNLAGILFFMCRTTGSFSQTTAYSSLCAYHILTSCRAKDDSFFTLFDSALWQNKRTDKCFPWIWEIGITKRENNIFDSNEMASFAENKFFHINFILLSQNFESYIFHVWFLMQKRNVQSRRKYTSTHLRTFCMCLTQL